MSNYNDHLHKKNPVTNRGITSHIKTACLTQFDMNKKHLMFNRNEQSHFSWIYCLIRCHSDCRLKSSLKKGVLPLQCFTFKTWSIVAGSDGNSPLHFLSLCLFVDWQECFIVCILCKVAGVVMPLALGEFLDVPQVTSNRSNIARLDHNACIPDCETFRWAPLERFCCFF